MLTHNDGKGQSAVDEESDEDGGKIVTQLLERFPHVLHLQMGQQH